jgi:hypothetical protein
MRSFLNDNVIRLVKSGVFIFILMIANAANAGGPLVVFANRPVVYRNTAFPLVWRLDPGALGSYTNADAARLVETAFGDWENIPTAMMSFARGADLPEEVTVNNYTTYWGKFDDGINPVLLDGDGQIIDAIRGAGAKNNVIGLAVSAYFTGGPNAGFYTESEVLINGALSNKTSSQQYLGVIKHELGHLLGLDHAQINKYAGTDGVDANDNVVPLMFPISTTNAEFTADDILAISLLYPASGFLNGRGALRGTIRRRNGTLVRGANVIAMNPAILSEQYSTVTDYLDNAPGAYEFRGLPPGNYRILAEPIVEKFTSGSSVGPYAQNRSDLSFIQPISSEYYNGQRESFDPRNDRPDDAAAVSVAANGVTENIDFLANDSPRQILDQNFVNTAAFFLPIGSSQNQSAVAMRFTPSVNGQLLWIRFFINGGKDAVQGSGRLRFSISRPDAANPNRPGAVSDQFEVLLSSLTRGLVVPNEIGVGERNIAIAAGQDFFVSAEVLDDGLVQLLFDDGVTAPTFRSSVKLRSGNWAPTGQAFTKPYNLMMAVAISGSAPEVTPLKFALEQSFPNPFVIGKTNASSPTVIRFVLPIDSRVELSLFDMLGRRVRVWSQKELPAGYNVLFWDGNDANGAPLSSGVYFYRLRAGSFTQVRKLTLVR